MVDLVVHCPFPATYAAEIYCTQCDHMEAKKAAFGARGALPVSRAIPRDR